MPDVMDSYNRMRGVQAAAFAPRRVGSDNGTTAQQVGPSGSQIAQKGVLIGTTVQVLTAFRDICKGSPDENLRHMYDELTAEVKRRGMKL